LLDANIPLHAALGNHDDPNQRYYKPFGMDGQRFYSYQKQDVRFFALDSNYMDRDQQAWLQKELSASTAKWKIPYSQKGIIDGDVLRFQAISRHGKIVDSGEVARVAKPDVKP
jgi:phosphodiesterase/alkaline phosphatase D-like protein